MTRHPGWGVLTDFMLHRTNADRRRLLNGSVPTIEDYKITTGKLLGAEAVLAAPQSVALMVEGERARRAAAEAEAET